MRPEFRQDEEVQPSAGTEADASAPWGWRCHWMGPDGRPRYRDFHDREAARQEAQAWRGFAGYVACVTAATPPRAPPKALHRKGR